MSAAIKEADVQLTNERKSLSLIEDKIRHGLATVSRRAETTLAIRSVQLAFMWLGKAKGSLGITNPYPNSTDASNKIIEPAADRDADLPVLKFEDEIEFCKSVRHDLSFMTKAIENDMTIFAENRMYQLCIENAWTNAENAKMWLGIILGLIRNEELSKQTSKNKSDGKASGGDDNKQKPGKIRSLIDKATNIVAGGQGNDKTGKTRRKAG